VVPEGKVTVSHLGGIFFHLGWVTRGKLVRTPYAEVVVASKRSNSESGKKGKKIPKSTGGEFGGSSIDTDRVILYVVEYWTGALGSAGKTSIGVVRLV